MSATSVSTVLVLLAVVVALTSVVQALFIDPFAPNRMRVDCGRVDNIICRECCHGGIECPGAEPGSRIFCCRDPDDCDVVDPPDDAESLANIHLQLVAGGARLVFKRTERVQRRTGQRQFEITLEQSFRTLGRGSAFTLKAQLAGADAGIGSLLYAVDFLQRGQNALGAIQANGYDVSLVGTPPALTCPTAFRETCAMLANQLSQGISASLTSGTSGEREPFLQGLEALGHTR